MQARKIRVLIVDHNAMLREGLAVLIQSQPDLQLVAAVASASQAVQSFSQHRPGVTLMDLDLPSASGITAIEEILKIDPAACVLGSVTYDWDPSCQQALRTGARKCLTKDRLNQDLIAVVRDCAPRDE